MCIPGITTHEKRKQDQQVGDNPSSKKTKIDSPKQGKKEKIKEVEVGQEVYLVEAYPPRLQYSKAFFCKYTPYCLVYLSLRHASGRYQSTGIII